MTDGTTTTTTTGADAGAAATAAAAAAAATPWHAGVEAETIGFWQNKGLDLSDPKAFATKLTEQYRAAEKFIGVPPDQVLKLPKADAPPEDIKAFRMRLGMPADAKEYDFTSVKSADGQPIPQALADSLRSAAYNAGLPKDAAATVAAAVQKHLDDSRAADTAITAGKIAEEKAKLAASWGVNKDFNHLKAMEGARRLGITPEAVAALEGQIGYAAVMEAMRKIGAGTSEDTFVERGTNTNGQVTTREGAISRKTELMADTAWVDRYLKGGQTEKREMDQINIMIDGAA